MAYSDPHSREVELVLDHLLTHISRGSVLSDGDHGMILSAQSALRRLHDRMEVIALQTTACEKHNIRLMNELDELRREARQFLGPVPRLIGYVVGQDQVERNYKEMASTLQEMAPKFLEPLDNGDDLDSHPFAAVAERK